MTLWSLFCPAEKDSEKIDHFIGVCNAAVTYCILYYGQLKMSSTVHSNGRDIIAVITRKSGKYRSREIYCD
jgi:hypothetical protein